MTDTIGSLKEKYGTISASLRAEYGQPAWRQHLPPVDELVSTILSQSTSDLNRDKGFYALKERFPSWSAVRDAPVQDIVDTIRPAGLANQKGPRIQEALVAITNDKGDPSLDHLNELSIEDAKAYLTGINGIGPKTAAIILLFAFGRPAFPVDTHVHRVTGRIGLIPPKMNAEKAHAFLEGIVPEADYYPFHLQVIQHGRQVCDARNPRCGICVVQETCDYFRGLSEPERAKKLDSGEA